MNTTKIISIIAIVLIVAGVATGYYVGLGKGETVGFTQGIAEGKKQLLAEQKKAEEVKLEASKNATNPYAKIESVSNPFKKYSNPFAN